MKKEKCEHKWEISCFEQYLNNDGYYYCYVICKKCGEVKKQKIEKIVSEKRAKKADKMRNY
jgi:hypothetical protein